MPAGIGENGRATIKTLTLLPHCSGPWLARVGKRNFSIPAELGRALLPMQGEPLDANRVKELLPDDANLADAVLSWSESVMHGEKRWHVQRTIWGQVSLVPERLVRWIAIRLAGFTSTRSLASMAAIAVICYGVFFTLLNTSFIAEHLPAIMDAKSVPVVLSGIGIFLLTGIWHEMGHAAALSREGYAPGRIGLGFLLVIPVLFAEVTAVGMLARRGRLRVDFSGMIFQLLAGGLMLVLSIAFWFWHPVSGALQVAAFSSLVAVLWSLLPFVRSDGYWAIADFLCVENLDIPWSKSGSSSRSTGWFMILFRLANVGFLVFLGIMIPHRLVRWMEYLGWWPGHLDGWEAVVVQVMWYFVLGMIWFGLGRHGLKLAQASWQDICSLRKLQG